jgi:hypothetical protein
MRWNCPHCQSPITAAEAVRNEWSFSKCHRCGGFALIKSGESNPIKIFQAPPGERILDTRDIEVPRIVSAPIQPSLLQAAIPVQTRAVQEPAPSRGSRMIPLLTGITSAVALGSGAYLYVQSQDLFARLESRSIAASSAAPGAAIDRLHQVSMAPDRDGEIAAPEADIAPMPTTLAPVGSDPSLGVKGESTSCVIKATDFKSSDSSMLLRVKGTSAKLRSGPGLEFPVLMTAGQDLVLEAYDWDGRWFKVRAKSVKPAEGGRGPASVGSSSGFVWIRNDLVERLTDR